MEGDVGDRQLLLSTEKLALNGDIYCLAVSLANGFHINESSEQTQANGHPSAGFPTNYSMNNLEVGEEEKVMVTSAESIHHFYGQLEKNSPLLGKLVENINQIIAQPPGTDPPLGLDSICFARYMDGQWYRGQIVEVSPRLKVHLVDYGDTIVVNESDLHPIPPEPCIARSVPVLAVPLGLFDVPSEVPEEVNQWFADHATDHSLTLSVVAKEKRGKLIVDLFDGSLNVNSKIRERILQMTQKKINALNQQPDCWISENSDQGCVPNEDFAMQEHKTVQVLTKSTKLNNPCESEELNMSVESVSEAEFKCGVSVEHVAPSKFFKTPNICQDKSEEVYASSIAGPHYFWCQYTNTDGLSKVSQLAQEAAKAPEDTAFPQTLGPGCPCLALFSEDNQWYRAQVTQKNGDTLHVLFVDFGNEADVGVEDVRSLPQDLLELAPEAFLCSLHGFDETKGSWKEDAYDDFYNLLVDKPLRVTVVNIKDYSEFAVPQYVVELECERVVVNTLMEKYWIAAEPGQVLTQSPQRKTSLQLGDTQAKTTSPDVSKVKGNISKYQKPEVLRHQTESVCASCIAEPSFFWCQYTNTDGLSKVSQLAQEAAKAPEDTAFPQTLGPGCPCLALFSEDNQWYRAQVTQKNGDTLHVLFVDFGNEADVGVKDVRSLPQDLLELAPEAFLCSLHGFDETKGSWSKDAYDDFYNLLVDKPLRVTVVNIKEYSEFAVPQYVVEIEGEDLIVNDAMQKYWIAAEPGQVLTQSPQRKTSLQLGDTQAKTTSPDVSKVKGNISKYQKPEVLRHQTESVCASCIAEPSFFWCQYTNTDGLSKVSQLAQEAAKAPENTAFPQTLGPGCPCLALFSEDNQWYRAQVTQKNGDTLHVLFVDFGNEADVGVEDVRSLPQDLLELAPEAFLCSLHGFDETKGSWSKDAYDDFYNLLVDKPLRVTVVNIKDYSEFAVPQYVVELECERVVVNTLMEKYWKELDTDHASAGMSESVDQDESRTVDGSGVG